MTNQEDFKTNTFTPNTYHPENEIWHYISKLSGYNYVHDLLKVRVKGDFFGLDIDGLSKIKQEYKEKLRRELKEQKEETSQPKVTNINNKQQEEEENNTDIEIHEPLSDNKDIESNAKEIVHTIKQAIEIYRVSQIVSYAKPILLYYSYARLARVLYLSTYKKDESEGKTHGLEMRDSDIICLRSGAFSRFHDSYSSKPFIYLDNYTFKWQDLL